nr:MAG TPA: hypothetical protein [Caudoviricetes sp.]
MRQARQGGRTRKIYFFRLDNAEPASDLVVLELVDFARVLEASFATLAVVRTAFLAICSPPFKREADRGRTATGL